MFLDPFLFRIINGLAHKWNFLDGAGIFLSEYFGYFTILIIVPVFLRDRSWRQRLYFTALISLSVILSRGIIANAIKFLFPRPRPFAELGLEPLVAEEFAMNSFPSGHAAVLFALGFAVFYFLRDSGINWRKNWGVWILGIGFIVGLGRIFAALHWPSDVLAGILIGLGSAYLIWELLPKPGIPREEN